MGSGDSGLTISDSTPGWRVLGAPPKVIVAQAAKREQDALQRGGIGSASVYRTSPQQTLQHLPREGARPDPHRHHQHLHLHHARSFSSRGSSMGETSSEKRPVTAGRDSSGGASRNSAAIFGGRNRGKARKRRGPSGCQGPGASHLGL